MASNINDVIDDSRQFGMAKVIKLLHGVAMRVENSWVFVGDDFINMALDWFDELWVFDRWICGNLLLSLWSGIDINANDSFDPFLELGHFLSREGVSAAWDVNRAIVIEDKLSVLESPSIILEPLFFISDVLRSLDGLFLKKGLKMVEPLHRDIIFMINKKQQNWQWM